jgi:hypothetical protein
MSSCLRPLDTRSVDTSSVHRRIERTHGDLQHVHGFQPHLAGGHPHVPAPRGGGGVRRGRRPTIDHVIVIRRVVYESNGFNNDSINRSMKMNVPVIGPHTEFKHW